MRCTLYKIFNLQCRILYTLVHVFIWHLNKKSEYNKYLLHTHLFTYVLLVSTYNTYVCKIYICVRLSVYRYLTLEFYYSSGLTYKHIHTVRNKLHSYCGKCQWYQFFQLKQSEKFYFIHIKASYEMGTCLDLMLWNVLKPVR